MSQYRAPLADIQFVMTELAGLDQVTQLPGFEDIDRGVVAAILDEAARFARDVLDPLNARGDLEGSTRNDDGSVRTPAGFKEAYLKFAESGWNGLTKNPKYGGQGLPQLVATAVEEMWHSANMAFDLCPLLTQGAIEAIERFGSDNLKRAFLPRMVAGTWTGTMNLTESQAGSDLAAVRTKAVPVPGESAHRIYKLHGQKIFITYGEHDYTDNIVHLVLARTPDAPEGVKGISLFVVPKFLVNEDGSLGPRNDVHCVSLEHKLGIHASPTAVMAYGDHTGAIGYLLGEENRGLEYMFVMMNLARFSVGMEGVGLAERAYQRAVDYARGRIQGRPIGSNRSGSAAPIIDHPDVRRMLMTMRASVEAMRALAYVVAAAMDNAQRQPDTDARKQHQGFVDYMIPIVKGCCTEVGQELASIGLQVHGGMGFIEETGAAQHYRDVRITTIYEGTTGIQANDFIGRKTARDGGVVARTVIAQMHDVAQELVSHRHASLNVLGKELAAAVIALEAALEWMVAAYGERPRVAHAGAVPYLRLWGLVSAGWQIGRAALVAAQRLEQGVGDQQFFSSKIATARFYGDALLPQAAALANTVMTGGEAALALEADLF